METTPAEAYASGSQAGIHPLLRQRMFNRVATAAEGAQPSTRSLPRRRSSLLSDLSDTRPSLRSSTDNLLRTGASDDMDIPSSLDEPSHWISSPVLLAILPAVVGLAHQNGSAFATDILTLALASWFLHWCVRFPWDWYHEAQQRQYVEPHEWPSNDTITEEDEGVLESPDESTEIRPPSPESLSPTRADTVSSTRMQHEARDELKREELMALACCFIGPVLGAYLLHHIRNQLTHAEGIVSDFNLTVFVLAAELRPFARLIKLKHERVLHLQRRVIAEPRTRMQSTDFAQISLRLESLEARLEKPSGISEADLSKVGTEVRYGLQSQLDGLTRAIRKYEKRNITQTMHIEARFQEVDAQLKDTLSLAAAAARLDHRPGFFAVVFAIIARVVKFSFDLVWDIITLPYQGMNALAKSVRSAIFGNRRQAPRQGRGAGNVHSSLSTSRMQSKSVR